MLPLPRIIYAKAKDGLVFRFLAYVSPRFQVRKNLKIFGQGGYLNNYLYRLQSLPQPSQECLLVKPFFKNSNDEIAY